MVVQTTGVVTAYGAAKSAGYEGTYQDFCNDMASLAQNAQTIEQLKRQVESLDERVTALEQRMQGA